MTLAVQLTHRYPGALPGTLVDVSFTAPETGVTALFGPSGAGKSTVIAAVAGLLRPDACRVAIGGIMLADTATGAWLPPERRRIGVVFQDARLFPHMSVATNLRYGARRAPVDAVRSGAARFDDIVDLLGLAALLGRRPRTLSGGETQRVAIGRALLSQPRLLLMDEPLASLDAARKAEIIPYLLRLHAAVAMPTLYVTHALEEVVALAAHLVLLDRGRVVAAGPLAELTARGDLPLAARPDAAAVLDASVAAHHAASGLTRLDAGEVALLVPLLDAAIGTAVRARIPAREVILAGPSAASAAGVLSLHNVLPGTVRAIVADPAGRSALVEVALGGGALLSRVTPDAIQRLQLAPGAAVLALVKSVAIELVRVQSR